MNIQLHGKHIDLGFAFQQYMSDSLMPALSKYFTENNLQDVSVHVSKKGKVFSIVIDAYIAKQKLTSSGDGGDAHGAFDNALQKLTKQVRRHKRKVKNHHMTDTPKHMGAFMATT